MTRVGFILLSLLLALGLSSQASLAQTPPADGRLIVTVVDQSGAVIPGAVVTVVGLEDATKKKAVLPVKTTEKGIATVQSLALGRYSVQAEFPGFELGLLRDLRIKAGDNKHVVVLPLAKLAESVTVGRDPQAAASDRASTFGTALTREQVESLSDDPDEMRRQLQDMAGTDATIRVDSFEGQQLPPKAQIKAVHITRDAFAAENHYAGGLFLDIITQPGIGPLRGTGRFSFYDSALDGQNPLIRKKGPAENRTFGLTLSGSLIKERCGFSLSFSGSNNYSTPNLYVATPTGTRAENLNLRMPNSQAGVYGSLDYALTKDQTMRLTVSRYSYGSKNQGVGAYDLAERAYSSNSSMSSLYVQEAGPLGRRFFTNTRFSLRWNDSSAESALEAPTIIVNDAFTGGGAQRAGGTHSRNFTLQSDLDYVRGMHSLRGGVQLDSGHYRSNATSNYLGTYTFESLAAYEAGLPRTYTRRLGDPTIDYWTVQAGLYLQDDIRVRKNLTLSPGVRFEAQAHLADYQNIGPRFGITWAPFKAGKTSLRASAGVFYDFLSSGTYEQTLRVDGFHQQELDIVNPGYPDPGVVGSLTPTNRYLLGNDLVMAHTRRLSAGIDQQVTKVLRVGATYAQTWSDGILVGRNLNAPVDQVRPDPTFANIIETVPDGQSRAKSLSTNLSLNFPSPNVPPAGAPRFVWNRGLSVYTSYYLARTRDNTDGAFTVPASNNLATEWGPSSGDIRHRVSVGISSTALKNMNASLSLSAYSGSPYTIRTGHDDNGDLIFNDRPVGVGRNTERTAWRWNSYGYFTYSIGLGKRTVQTGPGISLSSSSTGGLTVGTTASQGVPRYRLMISVSVMNLTNHANYTGYSGVMISPFFLRPTAVDGVRTMNLSLGLSF